MSFSGQALLALHVAAAIFALGPGTAAVLTAEVIVALALGPLRHHTG